MLEQYRLRQQYNRFGNLLLEHRVGRKKYIKQQKVTLKNKDIHEDKQNSQISAKINPPERQAASQCNRFVFWVMQPQEYIYILSCLSDDYGNDNSTLVSQNIIKQINYIYKNMNSLEVNMTTFYLWAKKRGKHLHRNQLGDQISNIFCLYGDDSSYHEQISGKILPISDIEVAGCQDKLMDIFFKRSLSDQIYNFTKSQNFLEKPSLKIHKEQKCEREVSQQQKSQKNQKIGRNSQICSALIKQPANLSKLQFEKKMLVIVRNRDFVILDIIVENL